MKINNNKILVKIPNHKKLRMYTHNIQLDSVLKEICYSQNLFLYLLKQLHKPNKKIQVPLDKVRAVPMD